tara:strand:+ start:80 stop:331 length:252 start_codon:yes stop_codon:yes gene_type:complete
MNIYQAKDRPKGTGRTLQCMPERPTDLGRKKEQRGSSIDRRPNWSASMVPTRNYPCQKNNGNRSMEVEMTMMNVSLPSNHGKE